jgi:cyclophilin family peptidyl-prolyl cis-trans isomerase
MQCGLHVHGTGRDNPFGDLQVNEKNRSNLRGTVSIAHWDVPDCGNTEFFINLEDNTHLDDAYGGKASSFTRSVVLLYVATQLYICLLCGQDTASLRRLHKAIQGAGTRLKKLIA